LYCRLVDFEITTTADIDDSTVALDFLKRTDVFIFINECFFIADKGYDVNNIYDSTASSPISQGKYTEMCGRNNG